MFTSIVSFFSVFVHLSIAQTKHDHANDDFQQTKIHTKKTNPNHRNRVLCFRAYTFEQQKKMEVPISSVENL